MSISKRCEEILHSGDYAHRCANRTQHTSGLCHYHRPTLSKPKAKMMPEFFTTEPSRSVGRMLNEIPINAKSVYLRYGDATLELSWNRSLDAFEVRTTHKGLRDCLSVHPDSGNRIFIRVGDRL